MVHPRKPSRGCTVCRKRRIKCDEQVPSCSYCRNKGVDCPGYRSQFDIAWRDQNLAAEKNVKRRKNASDRESRRKSENQLVVSSSARIQLPRTLPQDYDGYAFDFFCSAYIFLQRDPRVQTGFLEHFHPVWLQASPKSPLYSAISALSTCMLELWSLCRPDGPHSLSHSRYLKGCAALRKHLQSTQDVTDDVLMAALLLDMYDNASTFCAGTNADSPHTKGIVALIEIRKRLPTSDKVSRGIAIGARNTVTGRAIQQSHAVPDKILGDTDVDSISPRTPGLILEDLSIQTANLQGVSSRLFADAPTEPEEILQVLEEANDLQGRLQEWLVNAPTDWMPVRIAICDVPEAVRDAGVYQSFCDVYPDVFIAEAFNTYRMLLIRIQVIIMSCSRHLENDIDVSPTTAETSIQTLADDICASVPAFLGSRIAVTRLDDKHAEYPDFRGNVSQDYKVAAASLGGWSLNRRLFELVSLNPQLRSGQQTWIVGQLRRIKRIYCIAPSRGHETRDSPSLCT